eukprot:2425062-Rhodomonas_salina.1
MSGTDIGCVAPGDFTRSLIQDLSDPPPSLPLSPSSLPLRESVRYGGFFFFFLLWGWMWWKGRLNWEAGRLKWEAQAVPRHDPAADSSADPARHAREAEGTRGADARGQGQAAEPAGGRRQPGARVTAVYYEDGEEYEAKILDQLPAGYFNIFLVAPRAGIVTFQKCCDAASFRVTSSNQHGCVTRTTMR